ncbi:hypothetical protein HK102_011041, partial [Quaeritorhiza haematococci]
MPEIPGVQLIRDNAIKLDVGNSAMKRPDYDALLDAIGSARVVCIGDGSHGTLEFYQERAYITRRLVAEKGFTCIAAEADWPDAALINKYIRTPAEGAGPGTPKDAQDSLKLFKR